MALSEDHDDGSVTFARAPNELKLMFADQLGIRDVNALARTCREMNGLLTRMMYRHAKDSKGKRGRPYFLHAVDDGNLAAVERFVEVGAEMNMASTDGFPETAMHSCAQYGHVEMAEFLIDKEINVSAADCLGKEPLHSLVTGVHPNEAIVTLLVEAGADVNARHCSQTPLLMAAHGGNVRIVKRLLDLGADPNAANWGGQRAVHLAAAYAGAATVRCLVEAGGGNVEIADGEGLTPMHYAAQIGTTDAVKVLLEMGADVSSVDHRGWTPLFGAVSCRGNEATAHRILYGSVPPGLYDEPYDMIFEVLLAAGADIRIPNTYGASPLSWAVDYHAEHVKIPKSEGGENPEVQRRSFLS